MPTRVGKGLAGRCNRGSEEARGQWGLPPATLNTPTQGVCFMRVCFRAVCSTVMTRSENLTYDLLLLAIILP